MPLVQIIEFLQPIAEDIIINGHGILITNNLEAFPDQWLENIIDSSICNFTTQVQNANFIYLFNTYTTSSLHDLLHMYILDFLNHQATFTNSDIINNFNINSEELKEFTISNEKLHRAYQILWFKSLFRKSVLGSTFFNENYKSKFFYFKKIKDKLTLNSKFEFFKKIINKFKKLLQNPLKNTNKVSNPTFVEEQPIFNYSLKKSAEKVNNDNSVVKSWVFKHSNNKVDSYFSAHSSGQNDNTMRIVRQKHINAAERINGATILNSFLSVSSKKEEIKDFQVPSEEFYIKNNLASINENLLNINNTLKNFTLMSNELEKNNYENTAQISIISTLQNKVNSLEATVSSLESQLQLATEFLSEKISLNTEEIQDSIEFNHTSLVGHVDKHSIIFANVRDDIEDLKNCVFNISQKVNSVQSIVQENIILNLAKTDSVNDIILESDKNEIKDGLGIIHQSIQTGFLNVQHMVNNSVSQE